MTMQYSFLMLPERTKVRPSGEGFDRAARSGTLPASQIWINRACLLDTIGSAAANAE